MDGVMVDTEPLSCKEYSILLGEKGFNYTMDVHNSVQGCKEYEVSRRINVCYSLPESAEQISNLRNKIYLRLLEEKILVIDGLLPLLKYVKSKKIKVRISYGVI